MNCSRTLAIDYGSKYIGLALVEHSRDHPNRVLYAATISIQSRPLKALVETRATARRMRRTRKTHRRRLQRLNQALAGIPNVESILRFCRRRGYGYEPPEDQADEPTFRISRERFFKALDDEINTAIEAPYREQVRKACARHLNRERRAGSELRPARFLNRGLARCHWTGCRNNVPRAAGAVRERLQQTLYGWLQPIFKESCDPARLRKSVDHWIGELVGLSRAYCRAEDRAASRDAAKAAQKPVNKRIKRVFGNLQKRIREECLPETAEAFQANWSRYYRKQLGEIIRGEVRGRVRFCRKHSDEYVETVLSGQAVPIREDLSERDLNSRRQQIVFSRLWRLVEARLLPLAGGRIDRLIVERVAFDVLCGPLKARQNLPEEKAAELYWNGPQAHHESRQSMFEAEFGGRCAYCGEQRQTDEEHILPQSSFPFDSYVNLVPACHQCNARKGGRSALSAGMTIHPDAYDAYAAYLRKRKVLHPYQTTKKGILNLLQRRSSSRSAEQIVAMIADNLVSVTKTQQAARPLARYLATKLEVATGRRPKIAFEAGRHTALYRSVILPDYRKSDERRAGDQRNHAVDAILLACDLPSASALENPNWTKGSRDVRDWMEKVKAKSPLLYDGLPQVEPVPLIHFFEEDAGGGYADIKLEAFNWNRRRKASHKLDPFGKTASGMPVKRKPAPDVLSELLKSPTKRDKQINAIAHHSLREKLTQQRDGAPEEFVRWLQESIKTSLRSNNTPSHPADCEKRRLLEEFVTANPAEVVSRDSTVDIPWTVGIRCLNQDTGSANKVIPRSVNGNPKAQFYQSEPVRKMVYVGYCRNGETLDRTRPIVLSTTQVDALTERKQRSWVPLDDLPPESPLHGRPLGSTDCIREFRRRWQNAFDELCTKRGIVMMYRLTQGCVIEKSDGTRFQLRSFDISKPWMQNRPFHDILRVYRSPFDAMRRANRSDGNAG
jgi:5-methylcytosine-specific restriction endonuclease McrA